MYSLKPASTGGITSPRSTTTTNKVVQITPTSSARLHQISNNSTSSHKKTTNLPPIMIAPNNNTNNNTNLSSSTSARNNNNSAFYPLASNRQLDPNSFDAATIPWQRIHHGNIPAWEQERLLREVLMAMLLRDVTTTSSSPENVIINSNNNNNNGSSSSSSSMPSNSLHTKATQAATEVMSNFVKSAIIGTSSSVSFSSSSPNSNNGQNVSLGALKVPVTRNTTITSSGNEVGEAENFDEEAGTHHQNNNKNQNHGNESSETQQQQQGKWIGFVQDRRQTQLERLLNDAQSECAVLRQQLEDITKAHDDGQRALNQAYHEYDALQRHVLQMNNELLDQQQHHQQRGVNGKKNGAVALGVNRRSPKIGESADDPK